MDWVQTCAAAALPVLVVAFMAANLLSTGLELDVAEAFAPLRDRRFLAVVMAWDWVLCPGAALLLAWLIPMAEPYELGLVVVGMVPAAPFLPMMVRRAGGDLAYAAAFMLVGVIGTVIFLPLALPLLAPGISIGVVDIARPLLLFLLAPLALGMAVRAVFSRLAGRLVVPVKIIANGATIGLLIAVMVLFFDGFVDAVGSYAIGSQLLFVVGTTVGAYLTAAGLPESRKSVVSLGVCSRNLGAAFAPLVDVSADPRATVMVALAVPMTLLVSFVAARIYGQRARRSMSSCSNGRSG